MRIPLDRASPVPLYKQIKDFLKDEILSGALQADTKLPSTRKLAQTLGVNRITITNAYEELDAEGLIYSRLGSGTYVTSLEWASKDEGQRSIQEEWPLWQQELMNRSSLPTKLDELLPPPTHSTNDLISFAGGLGAKELFPIDDFRKALQRVLRKDGAEAGGYGDRSGFLPLRTTISHILASSGVKTSPDKILITSGSQQAFSLVANLILRPGDVVLVENPTYPGAIDLFSSLGAKLVGVPVDEQGMQVDYTEELLHTVHPSLIYCIPTFQNPTGVCLSGYRRRKLIALAERFNVPILEDEFVGELRYEGVAQPTLKALDPGGYVIYVGTFSKMMMPSLRIGYIVASGPVYDRLLVWKRIYDLATSNLIQRALDAFITVGRYEAHLRRTCKLYRHRRDVMLRALTPNIPVQTNWITPSGGMYVWVELPEGFSTTELLPIALQEKVAFTPGRPYFSSQSRDNFLRLNFAMNPPEKIEEGLRRLGKAIQRYTKLKMT